MLFSEGSGSSRTGSTPVTRTIFLTYLNNFFHANKIDMFDNLSFLSIQGIKTPCFKIFILLNSKFV